MKETSKILIPMDKVYIGFIDAYISKKDAVYGHGERVSIYADTKEEFLESFNKWYNEIIKELEYKWEKRREIQ